MLHKGYLLQLEDTRRLKEKEQKKDIPCKSKPKENKDIYTYISKLDFKSKTVIRRMSSYNCKRTN